jgi:hypothetical protein
MFCKLQIKVTSNLMSISLTRLSGSLGLFYGMTFSCMIDFILQCFSISYMIKCLSIHVQIHKSPRFAGLMIDSMTMYIKLMTLSHSIKLLLSSFQICFRCQFPFNALSHSET